MTTGGSVFVNVLSTWVKTDVKGYASRSDVIAYLEVLWPTMWDGRRGKWVQRYDIDVCSLLSLFSLE
jgi:hypothetical protein